MDQNRTSGDVYGLDKINFSSTATMLTQVGEWQAEVRQFFAEDWPRIREMIMELEESEWTEDGSDQATASVAHDLNASMPNNLSSGTAAPPALQERDAENADDPLLSLANRLNRKLTAAIASER